MKTGYFERRCSCLGGSRSAACGGGPPCMEGKRGEKPLRSAQEPRDGDFGEKASRDSGGENVA